MIVANRSVLWNASRRNSGRLAASPSPVSTTGMPSRTELPNAPPKPMIACRSNGPPNASARDRHAEAEGDRRAAVERAEIAPGDRVGQRGRRHVAEQQHRDREIEHEARERGRRRLAEHPGEGGGVAEGEQAEDRQDDVEDDGQRRFLARRGAGAARDAALRALGHACRGRPELLHMWSRSSLSRNCVHQIHRLRRRVPPDRSRDGQSQAEINYPFGDVAATSLMRFWIANRK